MYRPRVTWPVPGRADLGYDAACAALVGPDPDRGMRRRRRPPSRGAPGPCQRSRSRASACSRRGVVSTAAPEFAIAYARWLDGTSRERRSQQLAIVASTFTNGAWQPARLLPPRPGVPHVDPFVAARLYSARTAAAGRTTRTSGYPYGPTGETGARRSTSKARRAGPATRCASIARDGALYFQFDATGGGDATARLAGDGYPTAAPIAGSRPPPARATPRSRRMARSGVRERPRRR